MRLSPAALSLFLASCNLFKDGSITETCETPPNECGIHLRRDTAQGGAETGLIVSTHDMGFTEDFDQDGWGAVFDCDDQNPDIHPEAREYCNGLDDNCNGLTDDQDPDVSGFRWYLDEDGDEDGKPGEYIRACEAAGFYSSFTDGDCNDNNPSFNSLREEQCDQVGAPYVYHDYDCDGLGPDEDEDCQ